jgi:hypothetical protein
MNKKYSFLILVIIYCLTGCFPKLPKFIKSTSQEWSVGINNSSGTVYHILFKVFNDTSQLKIDSLEISDQKIKDYKLSVIGKSNTDTFFSCGDTVLLSFNYLGIIQTSETSKNNYIFYRINNKNRKLKIKTIKELKPLLNP